jgi:predicted nuclease of predicted toxin-antitoxin system
MKKIKLDENFPPVVLPLFQNERIDASSVFVQQLAGTSDDNLYQICKKEGRVIVTFDLDFANIIRFPSDDSAGIIVCRLRKKVNLDYIRHLCKVLVKLIEENELSGKLFIVEDGKVRVRRADQDL